MPFLGTQPAETALTTGDLGADIVTNAKIADDQIDSEHYVNGSIDTAHIAANAIDGTLTKDALIADYSDVTITASDLIMYGDATDSNNTKRDTVQGILDLAGGGSRKVLAVTTASGSSSAINFTAFDNARSNSSGVTGTHNDSSENEIVILQSGSSGGAAAGEALHFRLLVYSAGDSTYQKGMSWEGISSASDSLHMPFWGGGLRVATTDIDALQFLGASGTWSAKITMIGINNSV